MVTRNILQDIYSNIEQAAQGITYFWGLLLQNALGVPRSNILKTNQKLITIIIIIIIYWVDYVPCIVLSDWWIDSLTNFTLRSLKFIGKHI